MTHAQLFENRKTPGFELPTCPGELALRWSRTDMVWHNGAYRAHAIELYQCARCSTFLPYDASAGQVLNAYQRSEVSQISRELAGIKASEADL